MVQAGSIHLKVIIEDDFGSDRRQAQVGPSGHYGLKYSNRLLEVPSTLLFRGKCGGSRHAGELLAC